MKQELLQLNHPLLGSFLNPAPSCKLIPQGSLSGHYWIQNAGTGYANLEYCDMTRRCCNSTGGWMKVAHLDMTNTNQHCPSGFRLITSPKRTCGTPGYRCVSTTFPLNGVKYSRVCGMIIGYQYSNTDAFHPYYLDRSRTIDGQKLDVEHMKLLLFLATTKGALYHTKGAINPYTLVLLDSIFFYDSFYA